MNIIITGTSRGIGKDIAKYYLERGHNVAGCSRSIQSITHPNYIHDQIDVTQPSTIKLWVSGIQEILGSIDVAIANAGKVYATSLMLITNNENAHKTVETNLMGTYYFCKEVAKQMARQKYGRIITLASMTSGLHEIGTAAYSASKAGVIELTKILAKEVIHYGITVNCIAPSMYDGGESSAYRLKVDVQNKILDKLTLKRFLTRDELMNVINFYISEDARCITGQVIYMGLVA